MAYTIYFQNVKNFRMKNRFLTYVILLTFFAGCKKENNPSPNPTPPVSPTSFSFNVFRLNGQFNGYTYYNVNRIPILKLSFSAPVNRSTVSNSFFLKSRTGAN